MRRFQIIVERHPDGYVVYPLGGLRGVVIGQGDSHEEADDAAIAGSRFLETSRDDFPASSG